MGLDMCLMKVNKYTLEVIDSELVYWRKFNALHKVFVDLFQEGEDDCQISMPINKQALNKVIEMVETDQLQPTSGFFFGSIEKDDYYESCRRFTIEVLKELLDTFDFKKYYLVYSSSW